MPTNPYNRNVGDTDPSAAEITLDLPTQPRGALPDPPFTIAATSLAPDEWGSDGTITQRSERTFARVFDHLNVTWPVVAGDNETLVLTFAEPDGSASDLTGRTFACELRRTSLSGADPADYTTTQTIAANTVTFQLSNAQTRAMFNSGHSYFYDVQQSLAGSKLTIVGGPVSIRRDSTA